MARPLRLILIEDSDRDAAHIAMELKRGGWTPDMTRVETAEELGAALDAGPWDIVVSDYHLPRFSAPEALSIVKKRALDVPFIVVSGAIGEDVAVGMMREGAHDYLLKDRLTRLAAAIERELDQAAQRRDKRRAESLFQAVLRASPHPGAIVDRTTGHLIDGSSSFARAFLDGASFPVEQPLTNVIDFSLPARIEQLLARGSGTAWYAVYHAGGVDRVANVRCYTVEHEGASYAFVVIEDVTEQHYLKAAFDAIPDAVLVIGADQRLLYANRRAEELFGTLYFGMDAELILDRDSLAPRWWLRTTSRYAAERIVIENQPHEATSVVFRFAGETSASTILTLHNVAEEVELQRLAMHDALTGTYNVRYFSEVLPQHIESARDAAGGALAMIDLDHFKPINDELGHAAGDAALITFANIIRSELRPGDVLARLGGDEFAILFPRLPVADAQAEVQRIFDRLAATPLRYDGATRPLSASCGIVSIADGESPESLKERADRALYEAKRQGRARFVVA